MACQHSPADSTKLDVGDADRKLITERVLKRVRLSKATRTLQTRLSLASFKASRGWHNVTFDVIEPHMMQAAQQRGGRSSTAPVVRNGSPARAPDRRRAHRDPAPAPATFATPDRRPGHQSALQTVQRVSGIAPPTFSEFSLAIPHTDPRSTYRHVSAHQPSLKRSSPHEVFQTSNQLPRTPSGPEPTRSNEHVTAANVLSSLSRAPSSASLMSASPPALPGSCPPGLQTVPSGLSGAPRTSHTPEGSPLPSRSHHPTKSLSELEEDEAQTNAAELMLFLATGSPSPNRPAGPEPETSSADPDPAAARRLFGRDATSPTLHSYGKQQDRAVKAAVLSASSSQASSRSANSTVSTGSTNSYCGKVIDDLIRLNPDQRVRTAADARAKGRSLVRTQTQPAVGAEARVR